MNYIKDQLNNTLDNTKFEIEGEFGLAYPKSLRGVATEELNPRSAWENTDEYDQQAVKLAELFVENFKTYGAAVSYLEPAGPLNQNEVAI